MVKYSLGDIMNEEFILLLNEIGIELNDKQIMQFKKYYEILIDWNEKINLTAITEENEVYIKHFYDSLCAIKGVSFHNQTLLDVGSGAGFPSIPLKIIFPNLQVTIIDALQKRIKFLSILTKELDIHVELIHGRAEEYTKKNEYDLVTARAVANLQLLSELCIPFVKENGYFLALKGPKFQEEIEKSSNAFYVLKAELEGIIEYLIKGEKRSLIKIKKVGETDNKYPRRFNKIKSKPL